MDSNDKILTAFDGIELYTHNWSVENPRAVVLMIHGFGEHIRRYDHVSAFLNANNIAVVGLDTRGHGKSTGQRGHAPNYDAFMRDIEQFTTYGKSIYPNVPSIIYGHSMGGNLVLNFITRYQGAFKAAVVTSPWIQTSAPISKVTIFINRIVSKIFPKISVDTKLNPDFISTDKEVVKKYVNDPLVQGKMSAAAGIGVIDAANFLDTFNGTIAMPLLIIHGTEDKLISYDAAKAFAARVKGDVTFKSFEGMYHETHNEPHKLEVFYFLLGWINSKL